MRFRFNAPIFIFIGLLFWLGRAVAGEPGRTFVFDLFAEVLIASVLKTVIGFTVFYGLRELLTICS